MSDGKKAAYEEEQELVHNAMLKNAARLQPEQLLVLADRLDSAMRSFKPDTPLTMGQHHAIEVVRNVMRSLRAGTTSCSRMLRHTCQRLSRACTGGARGHRVRLAGYSSEH